MEEAESDKSGAPNRCATMCVFGCLAAMGCRSSIVRRLAFYPPQPAGYSIGPQGQLYTYDGSSDSHRQSHNQSAPPADSINSASGAATAQPDNPPAQQLQRESMQQLLQRTGLPERLKVLSIPCGRVKLAALFIYHPLSPSSSSTGPLSESESGQGPASSVLPAGEGNAREQTRGAAGPLAGGADSCDDQVMQESAKRLPCIIFSHGNSTDIGFMFGLYYRLAYKCRVNVLAYDYSGYGCSGGKTSEKALYRNIRAVWTYATQMLHVPPRQIILYGHSVGSAPCCDLAMREKNFPVGGVVLHSSIASGLRLFFDDIKKSPWFDAFPNVEKLKKVKRTPVLIIHGQLDRQVSWIHSQRLQDAAAAADADWFKELERKRAREKASGKKRLTESPNEETQLNATAMDELHSQRVQVWWVGNADHNDVEQKSGEAYYKHIGDFIHFCNVWASNCHGG
ncbi:alpha/beta hydrolase family protein [Toxoplasma gondii p89]|uniref:Alpha/beta hydrolase family protein n=1 Tax=Toxoplasma gondii p89 TaxID=943119 RepID=A0A086JGK1_TOXGO|nr:alpha/beta hydrolase family protein [Toxoplasma gondii p89]